MVTFGIVSKPLMCTTERQGRKISNNVTWCHHHFLSTWRQKEDGRGQEECMFRLRPLGVARDPPLWGNTYFRLLGNTRLGRQRAPSHTYDFGESGITGLCNLGLDWLLFRTFCCTDAVIPLSVRQMEKATYGLMFHNTTAGTAALHTN